MISVYDLRGQRNIRFLSWSRKEQKSCEFFHCNFYTKFLWLSVIYTKFQVLTAGIYVMRIRIYQKFTFELNTKINLRTKIKEPTGHGRNHHGRKKLHKLKFFKTDQVHWIWFLRTSANKQKTLEMSKQAIDILFIDATQFTDKSTICYRKIYFLNQKDIF